MNEVGGRKEDTGKLKYDQIPPYPLEQLAFVYTMGAQRYGDFNYLKGMSWRRVMAAMMRHFEAFRAGESMDEDGGQHHLASVAWGCFTLMLYEKEGLGTDDRNPSEPDVQDVLKERLRDHVYKQAVEMIVTAAEKGRHQCHAH